MKIAILRNEDPDSGKKWLLACNGKGITAKVIDMCSATALDEVKSGDFDLLLLRPPGSVEIYKTIYDERLFHIVNSLRIPCFPSFLECYIYENKKNLASFLHMANIAHPQTWVICHREEARSFIEKCTYPIVVKTSIGASGSGVNILRDQSSAEHYIHKAFVGRGIAKRVGPNRRAGTPRSWLQKAISDPGYLKKKLMHYHRSNGFFQKGYVIFQEYIKHDFEWRIVRIGESFFAYKKFRIGDKASGAKSLGFGNPPLELISWIRDVSDQHRINTAAFDVFENQGSYLINEIQTIFGHAMDHILEVNGKPGRYLWENDGWVFEAGDFNTNESYDLRLETAIKLFEEGKL